MSEGLKINDKNQEFLAESVPIINLYEGDRRNTIQSSLCSKMVFVHFDLYRAGR